MAAEGKPKSPLRLDEMDQRIRSLMTDDTMVGLAVAIVEDGEIVFSKGYGERRKGARAPVDENTIFRWASVSKGVGAATLLDQVDKGLVDASTPIEALAPSLDLPDTDTPHDIVDLLSHRIGIVRNAYDSKIEGGKDAFDIRGELSGLDYLCAPRTCHTYQNVTFDAAAEIVERATGLPYKSVVQRDIFDPLGMDTASLTRDGIFEAKNWAQPHNRAGRPYNRVKPTYYRVPAAAGVNSSVTDLAKWMIALMPGEDTALPEARLAAMQTPIVPTYREQRFMNRRFSALKNSHYGLGLRVYDYDGHKLVGHRGGVEGYRALILFDPEHRSGIAMMWNTSHWEPIGLQLEFMDQLHGKPQYDWLRLSERPRKRLLNR